MSNPNQCSCESHKHWYWLTDGYGIPLCKVCEDCKEKKLRLYRPDIFTAYEAEEPINPDE